MINKQLNYENPPGDPPGCLSQHMAPLNQDLHANTVIIDTHAMIFLANKSTSHL